MSGSSSTAAADVSLGPRTVTYPYRRIELIEATPADGPDPYGNPDPEWLRIDWRPHVHVAEVGGTRVTYAEIGEGPAIVLVHGLGGCWQNWLENMPAMAALGHRVVAIDLPGFATSPMPPWEITIPRFGEVIEQLCSQLELGPCTLVGSSMGGFIAAEIAASAPAWVERLVLISAAGISHATMRRRPIVALAHLTTIATPLLLRLDLPEMRRPGLRSLAFTGVIRHPERLRRELLIELTATGFGAPGFIPAVGAIAGYDLLDRLPSIQAPTLIVWGRDDLFVPATDASGYLERIPDSELVVFDDCGHLPMVERPLRFNRLLGAFAETARPEPAPASA